jgi:hypothetical protein
MAAIKTTLLCVAELDSTAAVSEQCVQHRNRIEEKHKKQLFCYLIKLCCVDSAFPRRLLRKGVRCFKV